MKTANNLTLSNKERLNILRNLGVMLSAGIPIIKAVDSILKESKGNSNKVIQSLLSDLNQGKTISNSLERFPNAFDPITTSLINSAEESGNLDKALIDVSNDIKKDIEFNEKIKAALTYPIFIFSLFIVIFLVILVYVIPRIATVFSKLDVNLPLITKILIAMSSFLLTKYIYVIIGLFFTIFLLIILYKYNKERFRYAVFSLPLLSQLANQIDMARITKSLGTLLKSGIPITKALSLSQQIAYRRPMVKALMLAEKDVTDGKHLAESFSKSRKVFPDMAIKFVEAGEQSGNLEQTLLELSIQYEEEVANTLKRLTTLLEPVMLVIMGFFIGGIMLSIIAPIYQLIGSISPR